VKVNDTVKKIYESVFKRINNIIPYTSNVEKEIAMTCDMIDNANSLFNDNIYLFNESETQLYDYYFHLARGCIILYNTLNDIKNLQIGKYDSIIYEKASQMLDKIDESICELMNEDFSREMIESFLYSCKAMVEYYRAIINSSTKHYGIN
jgi:hypothetical protein